MTKKFLLSLIGGVCLLFAGGMLLLFVVRSHQVSIVSTLPGPIAGTAPAVQAASKQDDPEFITGMPVSIDIPSIGVDLSVIPGYYDNASRAWTLTTTKAQFATLTTPPNNQAGNTFIYGHARKNVFGGLPGLQAGAVAIVRTDNGHLFYYTLSSSRIVGPADSAPVLEYQGKPILTLQTCVGLLYQNRELLTFDLKRVV